MLDRSSASSGTRTWLPTSPPGAPTLLERIYQTKLTDEAARGRLVWPSSAYAKDPTQFAIDVLGYTPTARQSEILDAVRDYDRVAIKAARKVGKSLTLATLATWFFTQYEDATVVLVAPSERQIVEIVWREIARLTRESGRCLSCKLRDPRGPRPCPHSTPIDGEISASVRTGLRAGMRRIIGVAPRNADRARGISGANQLWLFDESPGVSREIYDAADGNRAAGARVVTAGNPTSRSSWFYDCFTRLAFQRLTITALESPNVKIGRRVIPAMADAPWIEEVRAEHGEDSPKYQCDVLGEFPSRELLRLITEPEIASAFDRWETLPDAGDLYFGIDPAGGGSGGDESVIVARRGCRVQEIRAFRGGTDVTMGELAAMFGKYRHGGEPVQVNVDASGGWGADLVHALRKAKLTDDTLSFDGLDSRGDARNMPLLKDSGCARPRDAYWLNMAQRLKGEVGIPFDADLQEELVFAEWQADRTEGSRLIEKKEYRRRLGRSPDKADALAYALWEGRVTPLSNSAKREPLREEDIPDVVPLEAVYELSYEDVFDPYEALDELQRPNRRR